VPKCIQLKVVKSCARYRKAVQIYCGHSIFGDADALNMSAVSARLIASKGTKAHDIKHIGSRFSLLNERDYLLLAFTASCFSSSRKLPRMKRTALEDMYHATTGFPLNSYI